MDPIITEPLLAAALQKVLNSLAGETGKRAWDALMELIGRARRTHEDPMPETDQIPPHDSEIAALLRRLLDLAATNPDVAEQLREWTDQVDRDITGPVTNTVSGTVHGHSVQARDISGPITFN